MMYSSGSDLIIAQAPGMQHSKYRKSRPKEINEHATQKWIYRKKQIFPGMGKADSESTAT